MTSPNSEPLDPFDPSLFRINAELVIAKLEQHLEDHSIRGLKLCNPSQLLEAARLLMKPDANTYSTDTDVISDVDRLDKIIDLYIKTGIQVHSPGSMGRQFSGVVPLAGVMDFVSSIVNQPSSFYEAGQLPNVVERIMADELNYFIGWKKNSFAMVTTSGGSLANLTALLAARNDKLPESWQKGLLAYDSHEKPAIAIAEDAHYSLSRAAGIIGIGEQQIVRLPLNEKKQICLKQVEMTLLAAARRGLKVFCMVASSGTTALGAFDSLGSLADIAHNHGIWLHVDGSHGGSLLVSDKMRHKLMGIKKADSLTWDAHKMMFVPAMCTLLFYKDKKKSTGAFQQEASYVFEKEADIYTEYDSAEKNFECTKRPLIMNLWVLWAMYGKRIFAHKIDYLCDLTHQAWLILKQAPDFSTIHEPESNILCFRYQPENLALDGNQDFQLLLRNRIKKEGRFFFSKVELDGRTALRIVMMNHLITPKHFHMLLDEIRKVGQLLINERCK